jgi:hypothetical protein
VTIHLFCDAQRLSLCRRGHSFRRDADMLVFRFAERLTPSNSKRASAGSLSIPKTGQGGPEAKR